MRFAAIIMAALLALSLTACTGNGTNPNNNQNPGTSNNGNTNGGTNNGGTNGGTNNGNTNGGTNNGNTNGGTTNGGNTDDGNGLNGGSNNANGGTNNGNGTNGTNGGNTSGNGTNGGTNGDTASDNRRVMYNGNLYEVTDETLKSDEVGVELFSITNIVTETPAEDGDAIGLDEGTKVYRLKDDNEYNEVAVEINNVFYKAVKKS